tara:strand:- start:2875 stop:3153 length:279 start_codon:yes stop_codon:yes gene_type:complete
MMKGTEVYMDSSIVSKIDKSRTYAEEKERVTITSLQASFDGNHNSYRVTFGEAGWTCQCHYFDTRGICSHTMALERILEGMLVEQARPATTV